MSLFPGQIKKSNLNNIVHQDFKRKNNSRTGSISMLVFNQSTEKHVIGCVIIINQPSLENQD